MRILSIITSLILVQVIAGCGSKYTFTGSNIRDDVKTFQVNMFQNKAEIIEPGVERTFTRKLQDLIQNQTKLSLTNSNGDLLYEGEITQFRVSPMTATANQLAAQNRLTITVNVRFVNKNKEDDNFEKPFSFYYDYPANDILTGSVLTAALEDIFERITQDIFNASLAKW